MVLVTGGAGFIGSQVVRDLVARGIEHRILDDLSTGDPANLPDGHGELIVADICDLDAVAQALEGCTRVIHLAAKVSVPESQRMPLEYERVNAAGTLALLGLCDMMGISQFVLASTCAVYGDRTESPWCKVTDRVEPTNFYGATKLSAESYLRAWQRAQPQRDAYALRFFNVYGPRQPLTGYAAVIPAFITRVLADEPLDIHGDGFQTRDFIYVADVSDAILRCVAPGFHIQNVATGRPASINQIATIIEELCGVQQRRQYGPPRRGDVMHVASYTSSMAPGFGPETFAENLRQTIEWYRTRSNSSSMS